MGHVLHGTCLKDSIGHVPKDSMGHEDTMGHNVALHGT